MPVEVHLNDIAIMRKPHPCGSFEWRVVRVGADIGLRCLQCNHKVLLPRSRFERGLKKLIPASEASSEARRESDKKQDR